MLIVGWGSGPDPLGIGDKVGAVHVYIYRVT